MRDMMLRELWYRWKDGVRCWWYRWDSVDRWVDGIGRWMARRLPMRLRYWVVVDAFVRASREFPNAHPDELGYARVIANVGRE